MYVRLTYIHFLPEKIEEAKKIYKEEIIPVVKQQQGNIDIMLLEPTDGSNKSISLTSWESKTHADEYEASGLYKEMVDKARHTFSQQPILETYNA